jgi:hypothetical protein
MLSQEIKFTTVQSNAYQSISFDKETLSIITGTRVTDKDDISLLSNKITGKAIINNAFIDRRLKRKIKVLNVFVSRQLGSGIPLFVAVSPPVVLFIL